MGCLGMSGLFSGLYFTASSMVFGGFWIFMASFPFKRKVWVGVVFYHTTPLLSVFVAKSF